MKKILLGILMLAITIFLIAFGYSAYQYYRALHADDPIDPYVFVERGDVTVTRGAIAIDLSEHEQYDLMENDVVITRNASEATIYWPDRSITELGSSSKLVINRMSVASDYSSIELEVSLEQGKIWTNMIRTLYPGSYMHVNLPKQNVVAGVRGTVFEVNLENAYIHSIDHVVMLKNQFFQSVSLFPGEITSIWDIFQKLGQDVLDQTWIEANKLRDQAYEQLRSDEMNAVWERISGVLGEKNWWDEFVRWILSYFSAFRELEWAKRLQSFDTNALIDAPRDFIFTWYQRLKGAEFVEERDALRGVMQHLVSNLSNSQQYMDTLIRESLYDKVDFPNIDLSASTQILSDYATSVGTSVHSLMESFTTENYTDIIMSKIQGLFE